MGDWAKRVAGELCLIAIGWVKAAVDAWLAIAGIENGIIFRCVSKTGSVWAITLSEKAVWWVVREYANFSGLLIAGNLLVFSCMNDSIPTASTICICFIINQLETWLNKLGNESPHVVIQRKPPQTED